MEKGYGIQLVTINDDHTYQLNQKDLESILLRDSIKNLPVAVVSVVGAFRGGKSFLLNFFLRYLSSSVTGTNSCDLVNFFWQMCLNKYKNRKILFLASAAKKHIRPEARANGTWIGDESTELTGFSWRGGTERNTTGILMWSEPFVITLSSGERVAVFLMDTQGTFDHTSTVKDCATVFALSSLLSSTQINNIKSNINEGDLQQLQLFTDIGKTMKGKKGENVKAMQELKFLIRDWMNDWEYDYGEEGGKQYLAKKLKVDPNMPLELRQLHEDILSNFESVTCFLLPHPGLAVQKTKFKGKISEMAGEFVDKIKELAHSIFAPDRLCMKRLIGQPVTGNELYSMFNSYANIVNSDTIPTPATIGEVTADAGLLMASKQIKEQFEKNMALACGPDAPSMPAVEVIELHQRELVIAQDAFKAKKLFGDQEKIVTKKDELLKELTDRLNNFIEINKGKTSKAIENGYAAFEKTIKDETKGQTLCVHPIDINKIYKNARAAALEAFNINRKIRLDDQDADKDKFITDLADKYEKLENTNELNNKAIVNELKTEYLEYMMSKVNSEPNICESTFDEEHEKAKNKAIQRFESNRNKPNSYVADVYKTELLQNIELQYMQVAEINTSANADLLKSAISTFFGVSNKTSAIRWNCLHRERLRKEHEEAKKRTFRSISPKILCGNNFNLIYQVMNNHYRELETINDSANERAASAAYWAYRNKYDELSDHWYSFLQSNSTHLQHHDDAMNVARGKFLQYRRDKTLYLHNDGYDMYWENVKDRCWSYYVNS